MTIKTAFVLGAFGKPTNELWETMIIKLPFEVLKTMFEVWSKTKRELTKIQMENLNKLIEEINEGLQDKLEE
jgi:hypothetical protein